MSYQAVTFVACPELQGALLDVFSTCDQLFNIAPRPEEIALINFLNSPANTSGLQQMMSPMGGKKRQVSLLYDVEYLAGDVGTDCGPICTGGEKDGECSETYTFGTDCYSINKSIAIEDLSESCHDNTERVSIMLLKMMARLDKNIEAGVWADIQPLIGLFPVDVGANAARTLLTVATRNAAGDINPQFMEDIEFALLHYCSSNKVLFGWQEMWKSIRRLENGCCADSGTDLLKFFNSFPVAYFASRNVETELGTDNMLSLALRAVQLIIYNQYRSTRSGEFDINHIDDQSYKQTIVESPWTGMPYDLTAENTCGVWNFHMKVNTKPVGMPDDMYNPSSWGDGVNFANQIAISNP